MGKKHLKPKAYDLLLSQKGDGGIKKFFSNEFFMTRLSPANSTLAGERVFMLCARLFALCHFLTKGNK